VTLEQWLARDRGVAPAKAPGEDGTYRSRSREKATRRYDATAWLVGHGGRKVEGPAPEKRKKVLMRQA